MSEPLAIGIDLGATKIAAALITRTGEVLAATQIDTNAQAGFEAVADRVAESIEMMRADAPDSIAGIGIGTPGQVDLVTGVVKDAVNLGWQAVPLVTAVNARLKRMAPIWIQKDTNASAWGEYICGAARSCSDFVYLSLGSGLGSAAIANGRLINGATNGSDLGHWVIDPIGGRLCSCGLRGCAETVVSGPGLLTVVRELLEEQPNRSGWEDHAAVTTSAVMAAVEAGDPIARAALAKMSEWLGIVMAAGVGVLNPIKIVLGGGLGLAAFNWLVPGAERELQRRVLPKGHAHLQIIRSELKSSAIGAACLVWSDQRPVTINTAQGGL
jgi:glucokinase